MGTAAELAEYLAARAVVGAARVLPPAVARRLGAGLGAAAYRSGVRRDIVRAQIGAAFPGRDEAWAERTVAACYRHFGCEAFVTARLPRDRTELPRRVEADPSAERWIDRMAGGEGVVVVTGHLGNWELAGTYLAQRGVPLSAVVKRQRNARFDAWLADTRRRLGMQSIYMDDARILPALLARGRTIVLIADQDARSRGLMVTFLGRPASTFRGPARLALRTGAPLVFASLVRDGDVYRLAAETVHEGGSGREPPSTGDTPSTRAAPSTRDTVSPRDAELELTRRWVAALERRVRERPEQYFWFHRRWKSGAAADRSARGHRNEAGGGAVPHAERNGKTDSTRTNGEKP